MHEPERTGFYIDFARHAFNRSLRKFQAALRNFEAGDYNEVLIAAYFSVYHSTRALLGLKGFFFDKREGTREYFNYQYVKTRAFPHYTAKILSHLEYERLKAEYDVEYEVPRIVAAREILRSYLFNFLAAGFFEKVSKQGRKIAREYSKEAEKLAALLFAEERQRLLRELEEMKEDFLLFPKDPPDMIEEAAKIAADRLEVQRFPENGAGDPDETSRPYR